MNESSRNFKDKGSAFSAGSIKKVRRHTWSDSQDQEEGSQGTSEKEKKKQRHCSLGSSASTEDKNEANSGDLLGSILSGMWNPPADGSKKKTEWEGQPNFREHHNRWMMQDPLNLTSTLSVEPQDSQMTSEFKKPTSQSFGNNFKHKRIGNEDNTMQREQLQAKARSFEMGRANLVKVTVDGTRSVVQNHDGNKSKNKDPDYEPTFPISKLKSSNEINQDSKPYRSKSSWKRSDKLGSMRTSWRPSRAYDFNRNDMEMNDPGTPNDDFNLFRT